MTDRCRCTTQNGIECSRRVKKGELYCWQHKHCKSPVEKSGRAEKPSSPKKVRGKAKLPKKPEGDARSVLALLDDLGPLYSGHFGLYPGPDGKYVEREATTATRPGTEEIERALETGKYEVLDARTGEKIERAKELRFGRNYLLRRPIRAAKRDAETKIPVGTVVLVLPPNSWPVMKPLDWFDQPSVRWRNPPAYLRPYALPFLKSRQYVRVEEPFERVSISARKKGNPLTVDDVLFASRALMSDDQRSVDGGYRLLEETAKKWVLEPQISNQ